MGTVKQLFRPSLFQTLDMGQLNNVFLTVDVNQQDSKSKIFVFLIDILISIGRTVKQHFLKLVVSTSGHGTVKQLCWLLMWINKTVNQHLFCLIDILISIGGTVKQHFLNLDVSKSGTGTVKQHFLTLDVNQQGSKSKKIVVWLTFNNQ